MRNRLEVFDAALDEVTEELILRKLTTKDVGYLMGGLVVFPLFLALILLSAHILLYFL